MVTEPQARKFDDHVVRINAARLRRGMPAQQVLNMIERYVKTTTPKVIDLTGSAADQSAPAPAGR